MKSTNALPPLTGMKSPDIEPNRMEITIHVCDDTKNLKKDFTCPRDLLLREMKYFQDYLSADIQKWEDVDISVHCDIKIFAWLIQYVKRNEGEETSSLALDKSNAVSILISSDFLKMDQLVDLCIKFCHDNLSAIIATPCNMNCINDKLVTRIANTFDPHELELVKDKKDKFRGKLFTKKIEQLFNANFSSPISPNNGSKLYRIDIIVIHALTGEVPTKELLYSLFLLSKENGSASILYYLKNFNASRCAYCNKLLLPKVEGQIECISSRTWIDGRGNLTYIHKRDPSWDAGEYIASIKAQEKHWRNVYWRLWSVINHLKCSVCGVVFPLSDFKGCRYHPQTPVLKVDKNGTEKRMYPCCEELVVFFQPVKTLSGCEYADHQVDFNCDTITDDIEQNATVYEQLQTVVDLVCTAKSQPSRTVPPFYRLDSNDRKELYEGSSLPKYKEEKYERSKCPSSQKRNVVGKHSFTPKHKTNHQNDGAVDCADEDTSDDDETGVIRVVMHQKESLLNKNHSRTWNSELPLRLNQDVQRESDVKRMKKLISDLRLDKTGDGDGGKGDSSESGLFTRIESKYKAASIPSLVPTSGYGNRKPKVSER